MIREIVKYGHPVLRSKALPIKTIDDTIKQVIQDLKDTTLATDSSVGLSAPQINLPYRIFLIDQHSCFEVDKQINPELTRSMPVERFEICINPKVVSYSDDFWTLTEGCLSFPLFYGDVDRPFMIDVEFMNENGENISRTLEAYEARVFLHENDHLNGVLFIDRFSKQDRKKAENHLKELKKKFKDFNKNL